ncbi:MAG: glutathione peroxidase [Ferruginibacter sp.]|nr:glutathione peroxidase [Ferruginibacter sp.]
MIKLIAISSFLISCMAQPNSPQSITVETTTSVSTDSVKNIYAFKVTSLDGNTIDFAGFKGKKILIVNTASECGYTPQYKELQELYEKYKEKLVIVGFPANNFGGQEPGTDTEIKSFCQKNYGVTFPMAAKISVKGADAAPIYQWLTHKEQNGVLDAEIKWNFNKFLLDEKGNMIAYFPSNTTPMSEEITKNLK